MSINFIENNLLNKEDEIQNFLKNSNITVNDLENYLKKIKNDKLEENIKIEERLEENRNDINESRFSQQQQAKKLFYQLESTWKNPNMRRNMKDSLDRMAIKFKEYYIKRHFSNESKENAIHILTQMIALQRLVNYDKWFFQKEYSWLTDENWCLYDNNGKQRFYPSSIDTNLMKWLDWTTDERLAKDMVYRSFSMDNNMGESKIDFTKYPEEYEEIVYNTKITID